MILQPSLIALSRRSELVGTAVPAQGSWSASACGKLPGAASRSGRIAFGDSASDAHGVQVAFGPPEHVPPLRPPAYLCPESVPVESIALKPHLVRPFVCLIAVALGLGILPGPAVAQTSIAYGQTLLGSTCNGSTQQFRFHGLAGQIAYAHVVESQDFGGTCSPGCCCGDILVSLLDSSGGTLLVNSTGVQGNDCGAGSLHRTPLGPWLLPADDDYTVQVQDANGFGGVAFALWLQDLSAPVGAIQLGSGASALATVQPAGSVATFQFVGSLNANLSAAVVPVPGSSVIPFAELYLDGMPIALPGNGSIITQLPAGGLYSLVSFSRAQELGAYRVNLALSPASIAIFPASGEIPLAAAFDFAVTIRNPGLVTAGGSILLDGVDITGNVVGHCPASGSLSTQVTLLCPGLSAATLGLGPHSLSVTVNYATGTSASESVSWLVQP